MYNQFMTHPNISELLAAWKPYLDSIRDWRDAVKNIIPKPSGCGPIYELKNPINRPDESFAIADMRHIKFAEPHYHTGDETEIYVVLTGSGLVVVGGKKTQIKTGSTIVIPPDTAHFTIPTENLVLAVINTPPFNINNAKTLSRSDPAVSFDLNQFERLT